MSKAVALGIDIGGTKTLCLLMDKRHRIVEAAKFKTNEDGLKRFQKDLWTTVKALKHSAKAKGLKIVATGVGCAGNVNRQEGVVVVSPNLVFLEGFAIGKLLKDAVGTPDVFLDNDVKCGIAAEWKLGAAMGCSHVLGVFFGTGIGGAAVINGKVYRGASGMGGQVGGILAQPVGGPEAAQSHGILDRIASKAAIASEALVMAIKDWAPKLHREVDTDLTKVTWGALKRAIEAGDKRIEEMLKARFCVVGIALSSIVNFLNPEMVVLGGGLAQEMPKFLKNEVEGSMREYLSPEVSQPLKVRMAKLGSDAVALGAANEALEQWLERQGS
jgi:glucokinase